MRVLYLILTFLIINATGNSIWAQDSLAKPNNNFRQKIADDASLDKVDNKKTIEDTLNKPQLTFDSSSNIIVLPQEKRNGLFAWRDSVVIPKRSAFYSLIFPGLGQINNGSQLYIKLPLIYGALGVGIYFFIDNSKNYNDARREYAYRLDKGVGLLEKYDNFSLTNVRDDRDYYKRLLDMTVLLSVAGYGLQVIEANAAAHLKGFDVTDDISMQIRPSGMPTPYGVVPGITVAFKLK